MEHIFQVKGQPNKLKVQLKMNHYHQFLAVLDHPQAKKTKSFCKKMSLAQRSISFFDFLFIYEKIFQATNLLKSKLYFLSISNKK
jgi:hypothetical protein